MDRSHLKKKKFLTVYRICFGHFKGRKYVGQEQRCTYKVYVLLTSKLFEFCTLFFFLETFYFNFTTFERQIWYFLLHYKVLE